MTTVEMSYPISGRTATPVYWWAALGFLFLVLEVYVLGAWVTSEYFVTTPVGDDPIPGWMLSLIWFFQGFNLALGAYLIFWGVRTCRREGRVTTTMLFIIGWYLTYWQDPLANYFREYLTYNSYFINFGSWCQLIPGWIMPNGSKLPEPLLFNIGAYASCIPLCCFGITWTMRKAKKRWPHLGTMDLIVVALAAGMILDLVIEGTWVRTGMYQFPGSIHSLSIWGGEPYQFPIYQAIFWGPVLGSCGALYYFRDDKGQTLVERGNEKIRNPVANAFVRLLALSAVFNLAYLSYNAIIWFFTFQMDPMPTYPSYLLNEMCGMGTLYECPGPDVHVPLPGSGPIPPFTGRN